MRVHIAISNSCDMDFEVFKYGYTLHSLALTPIIHFFFHIDVVIMKIIMVKSDLVRRTWFGSYRLSKFKNLLFNNS